MAVWKTIDVCKGFGDHKGICESPRINNKKTGSVYISDGDKDLDVASELPKGPACMGMLQLSESGDCTLDQKQVSAHVRQLQKQLGASRNVIAWVQIWNACMGKFFKHAFGAPANCFGQPHVDAILQTFADIQHDLFDENNRSVTGYLREQLRQRFDTTDISDGFFYAPEELGGLRLQSPFIPFYLLKDKLMKKSSDRVTQFLVAERKKYKELHEAFDVRRFEVSKSCCEVY